MKKVYKSPALECIKFTNSDNISFTLNQSAVFNNTISRGIGENSSYRVFGVGRNINF